MAVCKTFLSTFYRLVEVEIKYPRGVERRALAVAVMPYTGRECYSRASKRSEVKLPHGVSQKVFNHIAPSHYPLVSLLSL